MRRGQDGDGLMSAGASKPASESGSEIKDGNKLAANQKYVFLVLYQEAWNSLSDQHIPRLSREEREELYKLARERIFGSSEDSIPGNQIRKLYTLVEILANSHSRK